MLPAHSVGTLNGGCVWDASAYRVISCFDTHRTDADKPLPSRESALESIVETETD